MKKKIVVTGGSGKAGKWIIKELVDNGYEVLNLDWKQPEEALCRTLIVDLTDLGQVHTALSSFTTHPYQSVEAVIHFAAIPRPFIVPDNTTYENNVMSTYNILEACANLGIKKAVLASSEASYGLCFSEEFFPPQYLPMDEAHPQLSEDSYGLSKMINEMTAEAFHRRSGMQVVSFRLGNILEPEDYPCVKATLPNPAERLRNVWSYIDVRDMAVACRLAVEKDGLGAVVLNLTADDTSSDLPNEQLIRTYLPTLVAYVDKVPGRTTFLANDKLKELLGWKQQYYFLEQ